MKRSRKTQPELPRVYVKPMFDRHQRQALREWRAACSGGERQGAAHGAVDPLWLRLGLRCCLISQRAGWVVSNPIYSDILDRNPLHDPSRTGPAWLKELYRGHDRRTVLCLLPGARAHMERRLLPLQRPKAGHQRPDNTAAIQADLFACAETTC